MKSKFTSTQTLKLLKNELPLCFKTGTEKLPLALNIHEDILHYYANDPRFDEKILKKAIGFYTQSTNYLKKVKEGTHRIDIRGNPKTAVKNFEEKYAKHLLKMRKDV